MPICASCGTEITTTSRTMSGVPTFIERVLAMINRIPGMNFVELCEAIGADGLSDRGHLSVVVSRYIRMGRLRAVGSRMSRRFFIVPRKRADPHLDRFTPAA